MKSTIIVISVVVMTAIFVAWVNKANPPDPIPEQWKTKVIDATRRGNNLLIWGLYSLGLIDLFSPTARGIATKFLLAQATGSPFWSYSDQNLKITDEKMAGVRVKRYEPLSTLNDPNRPVVVYFHGGGWVMLSVETYEPITSKIALQTGAVVISVDYRLSPQIPFPGPRSDCVAVVKHILTHARDLGVDPARIALAGDSAGGNLAASLALELKDKVALQIILVPALQAIDVFTTSAIENGNYLAQTANDRFLYTSYLLYGGLSLKHTQVFLNNSHVPLSVRKELYKHHLNMDKLVPKDVIRTHELRTRDFLKSYGEGPDTSSVWNDLKSVFTNPYFSPLMASDEDLRQTAKCFVVTAGYDIIREDGVMYYHRLRNAGVSGEWKNYPEAFHNAMMFHSGPLELDVGVRTIADISNFIRKNL